MAPSGGRVIRCGICKTSRNEQLIGCEGPCDEWFHISCKNITENEFKVIEKYKNLIYLCEECNPKCEVMCKTEQTEVKKLVTELNKKMEDQITAIRYMVDNNKLENLVNSMVTKKIGDLIDKIGGLETIIVDVLKFENGVVAKESKTNSETNDTQNNLDLKDKVNESRKATSVTSDPGGFDKKEVAGNSKNQSTENNQMQETEIISGRERYSTVAKKKNGPLICIRPIQKDVTSEKTERDVKDFIKPANLQVRVNMLRKVQNGGILIGCENNQSLNVLSEEVQRKMGTDYKVSEIKVRKPKIIVVGTVQEDLLDNTQLCNAIIAQNAISKVESTWVRVISKKQIREESDNGVYKILLEVDSHSKAQLLAREKLNMGWYRGKAYNYDDVIRCYNCSGFGHSKKYCSQKVACPKCAGEHEITECDTKIAKCINCLLANEKFKLTLPVDHESVNKMDCESYKRATKLAERRYLEGNE